LSGGILYSGILSRGILSGVFCPVAFCPVAFCPDTCHLVTHMGSDVFLDQPRFCICTSASRDLSAAVEYLVS